MALTRDALRERAFGQDYRLTPVDRFGIWLSDRRIRRSVGSLRGKRVADVGCGYNATFARTLIGRAAELVLVDVGLAADLKAQPGVKAIEGLLPDALEQLPDASLDVIVCNSVLEHLWEPERALREFHRLLADGGSALVNVPNWRGKWFLELSAYRLGLSPAAEIDDHKAYYDPDQLWPLLVAAGFRPRDIACFRHKFGLNTFAVCRKGRPGA